MKVMDCWVSFFGALILKYVILKQKEAHARSPFGFDRRQNHCAPTDLQLGDFQPGSITCATRRCGNPRCHCAKPDYPGHGPHFQITQKVDGKTVTQNLPSPAAVAKAEIEIAEFRKFQTLTGELVNVNRKICRLRPVEQTAQTAQEKKRRRPSNKKLRAK